jgi:hypothetical protein
MDRGFWALAVVPLWGCVEGTGGGSNQPAATIADTADDSTSDESDGCATPMMYYEDGDGDGFGDSTRAVSACEPPAGHVSSDGDCDDTNPDAYPGAAEPCGDADLDCDGQPAAACSSCAHWRDEYPGSEDGVYPIDADEPVAPQSVYCDMSTLDGGWTLVQRTVWDATQTDPMRSTFAQWRDETIGSPDPGVGFRLAGAAWPHLAEDLDHMVRIELRETSDGSSCAPLFYTGVGGAVTVTSSSAYVNGLSSEVQLLSHTELSTLDSGPAITCVTDTLGIAWFYSVCCTTCPAFRHDFWDEPRPMMNYPDTADALGNTSADVCASAPLEAQQPGFWGANVMEYYLR